MKILFVANVCKEHILKFHIPTIKKFKGEGWQVDVACSGDEEIPYCDNHYMTSWERSPFTIKTFRGIKELKGILNNGEYDVVFCHTPVGGLIARLASSSARKKGTKIIYCVHGFHFYKGSSLLSWLIFYPIEKYLSRKTDAIFTVNNEDYRFAKGHFQKCKDIRLVPEVGVDTSRFKISKPEIIRKEYRAANRISDDDIVLIYVAELIKNKNQKMLIDCLELLKKNRNNIKLVLVGPDHYDNEIDKYTRSKGLQDDVILLGWRKDVGELMTMADICVASSIREGFGINIVEAMYCGLPVVATNNRGHEMIISDGENGYLVGVDDYEAMSEKVELIINQKGTIRTPTKGELKKYDSEEVAKSLFAEIIDVVK